MFTVKKQWRDFPAAHRQHKHDGHCSLVHGHNWGFDVVFSCDDLDECGFVIDIGKLQVFKQRLETLFDHTCLINSDDPSLDHFKEQDARKLINLVIVDNCGMEGLAYMIWREFNTICDATESMNKRGVCVTSVTCHEDSKNTATYEPAS